MATLISPAEAAIAAGKHRNTIYNWIRRYKIGRKVGGRWAVDPASLRRVLDGTIVTGEEKAA